MHPCRFQGSGQREPRLISVYEAPNKAVHRSGRSGRYQVVRLLAPARWPGTLGPAETMTRKRITAGEVMAQLESDPEYVKQRALRDARTSILEQECRTDEALLVRKVRAIGYDIDSVWDLVNNAPHPHLSRRFVGPYSGAYSTLLKHLEQPHHPRIREGIVRALTVKDGGPQVEEALLSAFRKELDASLRLVLSNALRVAMPYSRRRRLPEIKAVLQLGGGA